MSTHGRTAPAAPLLAGRFSAPETARRLGMPVGGRPTRPPTKDPRRMTEADIYEAATYALAILASIGIAAAIGLLLVVALVEVFGR